MNVRFFKERVNTDKDEIFCCTRVFNRCNYLHYIEIPTANAGSIKIRSVVY